MAGRRALPVRLEWLALVAALAVGVVYDAAVLFKYPFAVGVDGYYGCVAKIIFKRESTSSAFR